MTLLRQLRAKGHEAVLDAMVVVIRLAPGADAAKAEKWAKQNEPALRVELVSEMQAIAGVRGVFPNGQVRKVKGPDGEELRGLVRVEAQRVERVGT